MSTSDGHQDLKSRQNVIGLNENCRMQLFMHAQNSNKTVLVKQPEKCTFTDFLLSHFLYSVPDSIYLSAINHVDGGINKKPIAVPQSTRSHPL